jgi:hypothetical protein
MSIIYGLVQKGVFKKYFLYFYNLWIDSIKVFTYKSFLSMERLNSISREFDKLEGTLKSISRELDKLEGTLKSIVIVSTTKNSI